MVPLFDDIEMDWFQDQQNNRSLIIAQPWKFWLKEHAFSKINGIKLWQKLKFNQRVFD